MKRGPIVGAAAVAIVGAMALLVPAACVAHPLAGSGSAWPDVPLRSLLIAALAVVGAGHWRLVCRSGRWHRAQRRAALCFAGGWLVCAAALESPLAPWTQQLFSAHMLQHEVLMLAAAPLLVLGRPIGFAVWAFAPSMRRRIGRWLRWPPLVRSRRRLTAPLDAWVAHLLAVWLWHWPPWFEAALAHPGWHAMQHASFLATAVLFWQSVVDSLRSGRGQGIAMLSVFTTMMHTAALGALLTLSPRPWYPLYAARTAAIGFDALVDQQLGGLVMWIPGGLAYVAAGLVLCARWLRDATPARRALQDFAGPTDKDRGAAVD